MPLNGAVSSDVLQLAIIVVINLKAFYSLPNLMRSIITLNVLKGKLVASSNVQFFQDNDFCNKIAFGQRNICKAFYNSEILDKLVN